MGSMSKRKGAAGEREAAEKLNEVLGPGSTGDGSTRGTGVAGLGRRSAGLHVEVKRCERLSLYKALTQARQDASVKQVPAVMHRAKRKAWVIVVQAEDSSTFWML